MYISLDRDDSVLHFGIGDINVHALLWYFESHSNFGVFGYIKVVSSLICKST